MVCNADFSQKWPLNLCNAAVITIRVLRAKYLITQGVCQNRNLPGHPFNPGGFAFTRLHNLLFFQTFSKKELVRRGRRNEMHASLQRSLSIWLTLCFNIAIQNKNNWIQEKIKVKMSKIIYDVKHKEVLLFSFCFSAKKMRETCSQLLEGKCPAILEEL